MYRIKPNSEVKNTRVFCCRQSATVRDCRRFLGFNWRQSTTALLNWALEVPSETLLLIRKQYKK
uniref:Uncharacterized protein n=1 Tax=Romanomermis culicivorax TaxID=13658 RepID=A0A915IUT9_ROMCU